MLLICSDARPRGATRGRAGQTLRDYHPREPARNYTRWFFGNGGRSVADERRKAGVAKVAGNYNRIARDLDRARRIAGLSGLQNYLWDEARELCWSFTAGEPRPFKFNFCAMERVSGRRRQSLSRECGGMVERGFFASLGNGLLLINKDFREWRAADGSPLFDAERLDWILAVNRHDRTATKMLHPVQPECDAESPSTVTNLLQVVQPKCDTPCNQNVTPLSPKCDTPGAAPGPPIGERARQSLNESKRELESVAPLRAREGCPPYPDEATSPLMVHTGAHPEDPAWASGFWRKLWDAFGSARVSREWYEHQRWFAPDRWEAALREAVRRDVTPQTARYLERLAADPKVTGLPDAGPAVAPRETPSQRRQREMAEGFGRRKAARAAERGAGDGSR